MTDRTLPLWKSLLFGCITVIGLPILVLVLVEGASSLVLFASDLAKPVPLPFLRRTRITTRFWGG